MKKRIFSIMLCLCLVLTLFPTTALAEGDDTAVLQALLNSGGTVTLEKDYTTTSTLQVNNTVTLDLNGHVVKMTGSGSVLHVNSNSSLTLQDSSVAKSGVITGGNATNGGGVFVSYYASFVMSSGTISNCTADYGGGVYSYGSFTMNGGTISNCTADDGGGVYSCGSFTMNGGTISNCTADDGGGVSNGNKSSFTINGGSIVDNSGSPDVFFDNGTVAIFVNGGEITGLHNTAYVNIEKDADKSGTTFYGEVKNSLGTINAGIYKGAVTNFKKTSDTEPGTISGGTFEGTVTNGDSAVISGGTFMKQVMNSGTISGGVFYDGISGGGISGNAVTFMKDGSRYALEVVANGNKVVAPIQPSAPAGMRFAGWYTDEALTEKYEFGSTLPESITLYAGLEPVTYTVSFDANGGTGTMTAVTGVSGDYTLPANGFTAPEGKQFKAWSVDGKEKAVGDKITVTADTTVKAVWETVPATPTEYNILDGANSSWTQNSDGSLSVRGSGAFSEFVGVKVDGTLIDAKNYTVKEGSTIVTLKADYLNTLTVGNHTLEIVWTDGSASTTFTVKVDSPQTGDNSMIGLWIALLFVSGIGVLGTAVLGKRKMFCKGKYY